MLRIGATVAVPTVLRKLGANPARTLAEAGFDLALFDNPDNQISYRARGRLLQHCALATGCPHFGLLVGQQADLGSLGLVGLLTRDSPDVGTALRRLERYLYLHVRGAEVTLAVDGGLASFAYRVTFQPGIAGVDHAGDGGVAAICNVLRQLCGPDFKATEIWLARRKPRAVEPYRRFFGSAPRFDAPENAVVFSSSWLVRNLPTMEPELHSLLQAHIDAIEAEHGEDFSELVRRILRAGMATGHAGADRMAALLSMHTRTLHRRLERHGTSYQRLLDEERFKVAQQRLEQSRQTVAGIAELLDYADARAFIRAFRRWSGTTPARWRQRTAMKRRRPGARGRGSRESPSSS
ncbi:MAG: AraC family transcriptional regulator [Steroidobacteraceae bacterium]